MLAADRFDPLPEVVEPIAGSVDLNEQDGARVERIARVHRGLDRFGRELIHHLDRARDDARGDDR